MDTTIMLETISPDCSSSNISSSSSQWQNSSTAIDPCYYQYCCFWCWILVYLRKSKYSYGSTMLLKDDHLLLLHKNMYCQHLPSWLPHYDCRSVLLQCMHHFSCRVPLFSIRKFLLVVGVGWTWLVVFLMSAIGILVPIFLLLVELSCFLPALAFPIAAMESWIRTPVLHC